MKLYRFERGDKVRRRAECGAANHPAIVEVLECDEFCLRFIGAGVDHFGIYDPANYELVEGECSYCNGIGHVLGRYYGEGEFERHTCLVCHGTGRLNYDALKEAKGIAA
ncbi:hypothetical protein KKC97_03340 [bacterium]|nr:hypothetical protein [bacterium]MBU1636680.1 hypothetical protein [bacterium]